MTDAWEPDQYDRFKDQRAAPFGDLSALIQPVPGGSAVDLGCGTGELTVVLHERAAVALTLGIDRSAEMLKRADGLAVAGVTFRAGNIEDFDEPASWDLVVANASLHWLADHHHILTGWTASLRPGGQLAVQVPANVDHPAHRVAAEVAASAEFADAFGGAPPADPVLAVLRPEEYAELLDRLGFEAQHVRLQVYGHQLSSTAEVIEWMKGTSLTRFRAVLDDADYERFLTRYGERLLEVLGDRRPYFYAFKRILFWGKLPH